MMQSDDRVVDAAVDALFVPDGDRMIPTEFARGPWNPNALHGGPVAALLVRAVERHDPGPATFVARVTVELLRPVPLAPLRVACNTFRPGKKVQWVDVALFDEHDTMVASARGLRLRGAASGDAVFDVGDGAEPPARAMPKPPEEASAHPIGLIDEVGFWSALDFRLVAGDWREAGPGSAWLRLKCAVVAGEAPTGVQRACAAADMSSGVGNTVRATAVGTINPELTVHLHRVPEGEWIGLDSRAWAHAHGTGMCESRIHDERGSVGRSVQALLVVETVPFIGRTVGDQAR